MRNLGKVSVLCGVGLYDYRRVERRPGRIGSRNALPYQKQAQRDACSYEVQLGSQRDWEVPACGVCIASTCFSACLIFCGLIFFECGSPRRSNHSRRRSPVLRHSNAAYFSPDLYTMPTPPSTETVT